MFLKIESETREVKDQIVIHCETYHLATILEQQGTYGGGHYVCYVKDGEKWTILNDSTKEYVDRKKATKSPYCVLYRHTSVPVVKIDRYLPAENLGNTCYANTAIQFLRPLTADMKQVYSQPFYEKWKASLFMSKKEASRNIGIPS
jgi:ubiquitin C-terminal hydrolase